MYNKTVFKIIKTTLLLLILTIPVFLYPKDSKAQIVFPGVHWETRDPSEIGLDGSKLNQFASNVGGTGVIIKDGFLVKTWGNATAHGEWASASKPLLSTLLFFAIQEGKVSGEDDSIDALWNGDLIQKDKPMTFRHLANMISGYARGEAPGAAWAYNDYGIKLYMLSVYEKVFNISATNASEVESLHTTSTRLGPLQFEDGSLFTIKSGAPRVYMTSRDYARVGWFWVNKGNWNGQQLLPQHYFDNNMKPDVPGTLPRSIQSGSDYLHIGTAGGDSNQRADGPGVYGFTWWFNAKKATSNNWIWPDATDDTFVANGHNGKEVMAMIPSIGIVAAARGNWGDLIASGGMNQNLKLLKESVTDTSPTPTATPPVSPTPTPGDIPGDANGDKLVDGQDFNIWFIHYGQQTGNGASDGDFDGNDTVNVNDYVIWVSNYSP